MFSQFYDAGYCAAMATAKGKLRAQLGVLAEQDVPFIINNAIDLGYAPKLRKLDDFFTRHHSNGSETWTGS